MKGLKKIVLVTIALLVVGYLIIKFSNIKDDNIYENKLQSIEYITVEITGEVNKPGKYKIPSMCTLSDLVNCAMGITEKADEKSIRYDECLVDGNEYYITKKEITSLSEDDNELLNINQATKEELMSLPGIGNERADDILLYIDTNGKFYSFDQLKEQIKGISNENFEQIKSKTILG